VSIKPSFPLITSGALLASSSAVFNFPSNCSCLNNSTLVRDISCSKPLVFAAAIKLCVYAVIEPFKSSNFVFSRDKAPK